jgi:hypothetical protein
MQEIDEAMVEGGNENCDHRMLVGEAQLPFHSVGLGERLDGGNILHADHHIDFETRYFFSRVEWEIAEFTISAGKIAASPSQLPTTRSSAAPGAWLQVETTGVTVHGSTPHFGVNAIYKAARAIGNFERFSFDVAPHPLLGGPTLNVGTI